jgi:hypothetical protein
MDPAAIRLDETVDTAKERRLAGARWPDDEDGGLAVEREGNAAERVIAGRVRLLESGDLEQRRYSPPRCCSFL